MRDLNLKEMMTSRESHLIMKAFSVDVDELGSNGTQKDDVDFIISRLNHGDASFVHESWQKLTRNFDLDTIERIINGIKDDEMVSIITGLIKKEYQRLLRQEKIEAIYRIDYYDDGWGPAPQSTDFDEIIDEFSQHRLYIQDGLREEEEERKKAAEFFRKLQTKPNDFLLPFSPLLPDYFPSEKKSDEHPMKPWLEFNSLETTIEDQRTIIAQQKKDIDKLQKNIGGHKKSIKEHKCTIKEHTDTIMQLRKEIKKLKANFLYPNTKSNTDTEKLIPVRFLVEGLKRIKNTKRLNEFIDQLDIVLKHCKQWTEISDGLRQSEEKENKFTQNFGKGSSPNIINT